MVETSSTQDSIKSKAKKGITETDDLNACEDSTKNAVIQNSCIGESSSSHSVNMKRNLSQEFEDTQTHLTKKPKTIMDLKYANKKCPKKRLQIPYSNEKGQRNARDILTSTNYFKTHCLPMDLIDIPIYFDDRFSNITKNNVHYCKYS